jgi:hypothetical protein
MDETGTDAPGPSLLDMAKEEGGSDQKARAPVSYVLSIAIMTKAAAHIMTAQGKR